MNKQVFSLCVAALMMVPLVVWSQERTAAGSLSQEASWSALKNLVEQANKNAQAATITSMDARDRALAVQAVADKILECGKLGRVFNGSGCAAVESSGNRWVNLGPLGSNYSGNPRNCPSAAYPGRPCTQAAGYSCRMRGNADPVGSPSVSRAQQESTADYIQLICE